MRAWNANWIGYEQHPANELGVFAFRLDFKRQEGLFLRVSADQRYRLFLNGEQVGEGPQRGDLAHWFYEEYDLRDRQVEGENRLCALVWNFGRYAPMAQHSARLGLAVDGVEGDWRVRKLGGWSFDMMHEGIGPFYIDVGPGEIIDSRSVPADPFADGSDWREPNVICAAEPRGALSGDTPWMLVPRALPPMRRERRTAGPALVEGNGRELPLVLDFGELLCAYPRFRLSGEVGTRVRVAYAEAPTKPEGGKGKRSFERGDRILGYADEMILNGDAEYEFEPLWWRTFRYVSIESDCAARLEAVEADETGYPLQEESSFECDREEASTIWSTCVRTAQRCAGETYFDCPYYEQLQYAGDTRIQALIGYYLSRDRLLQRNAIETFSWFIQPGGLTASRYPSRQLQIIPPFTLWWILSIYDSHMHDRPVSTRWLDLAKSALNAFDQMVSSSEHFWPFVDWVPEWSAGVPPGGLDHSVNKLTRWLAADAIARMSGEPSPNPPPHPPEDSEHEAALYRLCVGDPPPWPDKQMILTGYYFAYYKHLAKRPIDFWAELEPWREMLALGLTTFAENPEPTRSDCHAWSAHPILGFLQVVAGVTSAAPGWERARIEPNPGSLERFHAKIAHPKGDLTVALESRVLEIESPVPFELAWQGKESIHEPGQLRI